MTPAQATLIRRFCYLSDKVLARAVSEVGPPVLPRAVSLWRREQGFHKAPRGRAAA